MGQYLVIRKINKLNIFKLPMKTKVIVLLPSLPSTMERIQKIINWVTITVKIT